MTSFTLRWDVNKDLSILHVINFLISNHALTLESSRSRVRSFHIFAQDVNFDISDELTEQFEEMLKSNGYYFECKYADG